MSVDLYEMFLAAMQQGGFPRINKNNKWAFLSKKLGILPKDKPANPQDLEQVGILKETPLDVGILLIGRKTTTMTPQMFFLLLLMVSY